MSPVCRLVVRWGGRAGPPNAADRRKPDQTYGTRRRRVTIEAISTQDLRRTSLTACQPCVVYPHFACGTDLPFAAILIQGSRSECRSKLQHKSPFVDPLIADFAKVSAAVGERVSESNDHQLALGGIHDRNTCRVCWSSIRVTDRACDLGLRFNMHLDGGGPGLYV